MPNIFLFLLKIKKLVILPKNMTTGRFPGVMLECNCLVLMNTGQKTNFNYELY